VANYNEISLITLEPSAERELQRNDTFCRKMNLLSLVENCIFGISTREEAGLLLRQGN